MPISEMEAWLAGLVKFVRELPTKALGDGVVEGS